MTIALAIADPKESQPRPRSAYVSLGPLQQERWHCEACRTQCMIEDLHIRHWWFDEARRHVRWARGHGDCSIAGECYGRNWHLGQARQARKYAHNVSGIIEGRPNRYVAERQGVAVDKPRGRR